MATYLQGVTDYIPQIQPFTPDYNFLSNILQTKQSRYDTAHKQLNKMYGTLLYAPMLRDDNIQQRDQFFQMIDQDIKKMSGMDLSQQQNVDAAEGVFKSIYDNKSIIKDMTFTKQFQNEMQRAENFKNCTDQDACGGTYWEPGVNALQYKAEEFKNASADEAMGMQAPTYTPFINITEKAVKYAKDLMGSGFNVEKVDWSPDGRYIITSKNGQNLTVPLYQLMQNQYGNDYKIQDMYQTMAYVQRKNYVKMNAAKFGGDEGAAEEEYINLIQDKVKEIQGKAIDAQQNSMNAQAKKQALQDKIKTKGTTGDDDLANAYQLADYDYNQHAQVVDRTDKAAKNATAITTSGENRKARAQAVDAVIASSLMDGDFDKASRVISNLTGSVSVKEDPYAKSYYDHSLAMSRLAKEHEYRKDEELFKAQVEIKKKEAEANAEYGNRGPANSMANTPKYVDAVTGTSAPTEKTDEQMEAQAYVGDQITASQKFAGTYVRQYAAHLMNVISPGSQYSTAEQQVAKGELKKIFPEFDATTNKFVSGGKEVNVDDLLKDNPIARYGKANASRKDAGNAQLFGDFFAQTLDPISQQYDVSRDLMDISSTVYKENNKNVLSYALSSDQYLKDSDEKTLFKGLFKDDGTIRSKAEYQALVPGSSVMGDDYDEMMNIYKQVYNSGSSKGIDPKDPNKKVALVKAVSDGQIGFGMFAEGKTAGGGLLYSFDASQPAAQGTRGLLTFGDNAMQSQNALFSAAIAGEEGDAIKGSDEDAAKYKEALSAVLNDTKMGYDSKDKKRPFGEVMYMDLALSNPKYQAIHINFAPSYMEEYKGSDKNPGWGRDEEIKKNGITVYIPKDEANNEFSEAVKAKPYDIILNYKPVTISKPNAGSVTISKDQTTGEYRVGGNLVGYTGRYYTNGQPEVQNVNPGKIYSSDVGGQNLYEGIYTWLDELNTANSNFLNNVPTQKQYDPSQIPALGGQDQSALDMFNQSMGL